MFVNKDVKFFKFLVWVKWEVVFIVLWSTAIVALNSYLPKEIDISLPWFPIGIIGTAVAFYLGFKNNASYERTWEARKIWGAIVNDSRTFSMMVREYFGKNSSSECIEVKHRIIKRHVAWLFQLAKQLRTPRTWEHNSKQDKKMRDIIKLDFPFYFNEEKILSYISENEYSSLKNKGNYATQLIANQTKDLTDLAEKDEINEFRLVEMVNTIARFYDHQGKCERIKNFPLPRQYSSFSRYFVFAFLLLLPLGMIDAISRLHDTYHLVITIPLTLLTSWFYYMMELIGDYEENPFENLPGDIPMLNLARTIEIDIMEMHDMGPLPERINPVDDYLM